VRLIGEGSGDLAKLLEFSESYADGQGLVDQRHGRWMERTESATQAPLVDRPNLVQQDDRIRVEAALRGLHEDLGRVEFGVVLGRDRRNDGEVAESVADIVLDDERRPRLSDLAALRRVESDQVDVASLRNYRRAARRHTSSAQGVPIGSDFTVPLSALEVALLEPATKGGAIACGPLHEFVEEATAVALGRHTIEQAHGLLGERDVDASLHGCGTSHIAVSIHTGVCSRQTASGRVTRPWLTWGEGVGDAGSVAEETGTPRTGGSTIISQP